MKTAISDLHDKVNSMIEDNSKYKSQFHKGFLYAMGMVKEVIEEKLLADEKQQIISAATCGYFEAREGQHDPDCYGIEYYETTYQNTNE